MAAGKATQIYEDKLLFLDGTILQVRLWQVPRPVEGSAHHLKYSLFYGRPGERIVLYDNERPKGDHRHLGGREERYTFTTVERLVEDFLEDVRAYRNEAASRSGER